MKTAITGIRRYGRNWLVRLACGHSYTLTPDQLREQQAYVNKALECQQHAKGAGGPAEGRIARP